MSGPGDPRAPGTARPIALSYGLFYSAVFLGLGMLLPFWPLWLSDAGFDPKQVGWLLGVTTWLKLLSVPTAAMIADRRAQHRRILVVTALLSALGFACFPWTTQLWQIVGLQLLVALAFQSIIPLGEAQAIQAAKVGQMDYGRVRLWGSVAFVLGAFALGPVLFRQDPDFLVWGMAGAMLLTAVAATGLPRSEPAGEKTSLLGDARSLLSDRPYLLVLLIGSLLAASHAAYYAFSALHWTAAGYSKLAVGALWAEGVVAEILFFYLGSRILSRIGAAGLLSLAAFAGLVRWGILAGTTELLPLVFAQALHALTFGAAHLGALTFIAARAPQGLRASAQGLYDACAIGLAMGLVLIGSGWLYDYAPWTTFAAMSLLCLTAFALTSLFFVGRRRFL